jgi:hypothetical protein
MTTLKYSPGLKNRQQDAITTEVGANGFLNYYDGAQPNDPTVAITTQNLLVQFALGAAVGPASVNGVLTAAAIADGAGKAAAASGKNATWFSLTKADGTRVVDGGLTQTGGGGDITIDNPNIAQNQVISVTSLTLTNPN